MTNARGFTRTYTNSKRGEVLQLQMPESNTGSTVTSWSTEQWSYDGNGDTVASTNGASQTISYVYDDANRMTKVDYNIGTGTTFTYDNADRFTTVLPRDRESLGERELAWRAFHGGRERCFEFAAQRRHLDDHEAT